VPKGQQSSKDANWHDDGIPVFNLLIFSLPAVLNRVI